MRGVVRTASVERRQTAMTTKEQLLRIAILLAKLEQAKKILKTL